MAKKIPKCISIGFDEILSRYAFKATREVQINGGLNNWWFVLLQNTWTDDKYIDEVDPDRDFQKIWLAGYEVNYIKKNAQNGHNFQQRRYQNPGNS